MARPTLETMDSALTLLAVTGLIVLVLTMWTGCSEGGRDWLASGRMAASRREAAAAAAAEAAGSGDASAHAVATRDKGE